MRRIAILILSLLLLTACTASPFTTDEYLYEYDQNRNLGFKFCSTEAAYYGNSELMYFGLRYFDKASGIGGVLCAKPECMHNSSDCNAFCAMLIGVSAYDGKLYWVSKSFDHFETALFCSNLDGTERRELFKLPEEMDDDYKCAVIHRGYVFFADEVNEVSLGVPSNGAKVICASMDGKKTYTVLDKSYTGEDYINVNIQAVANELYIMVRSLDDVELYSYDIHSHKLRELYIGETNFTPDLFWVAGDMIYVSGNVFTNHNFDYAVLYAYDMKSKSFEQQSILSDAAYSGYIVTGFSDEYIILSQYDADSYQVTVKAIDYDGNERYTVQLPDYTEHTGRRYIGYDNGAVIYEYHQFAEPETTAYWLVPLDGSEPTTLWSIVR